MLRPLGWCLRRVHSWRSNSWAFTMRRFYWLGPKNRRGHQYLSIKWCWVSFRRMCWWSDSRCNVLWGRVQLILFLLSFHQEKKNYRAWKSKYRSWFFDFKWIRPGILIVQSSLLLQILSNEIIILHHLPSFSSSNSFWGHDWDLQCDTNWNTKAVRSRYASFMPG